MSFLRLNILQSRGYVPGEQPTDPAVIKLNTNESPYPPPPPLFHVLPALSSRHLPPYPSPSGQAFREAAARIHGHRITPSHILPFNGGDELLSVAIRAAATENDTVAYLEPSYSLYPVLTELHGAKPLTLHYEITDSSSSQPSQWRLPADIARTRAAILLIVNPNAPSGHLESLSTLETIATTFPGLLVIDEAYVDFAPTSALSLVNKYPNILLLRTMSKGYGLAGLRFGYAIAQPTLLREIEKVRDSYAVDAVSIAVAAAAIEDQTYAQSTWEKVKSERARVAQALQALGFTLPISHSNFVLARVPPSLTGQRLYEELKARHILVRWWDLPRIADKVRITIGTPEQNNRLLTALQEIIPTSPKQ